MPRDKQKQREVHLRFKRRLKQKAVEYKGGKCIVCGYNKCQRALEFHHLRDKLFSIGSHVGPKNWVAVKEELDKCILVCGNCHMEIEDGLIKI